MNVMTLAWNIAREGQSNFGGKVTDYFAQALKLAWAKIKEVVKVETAKFAVIETTSGSRKHKSWVAKLTGKDSRFEFKREFIEELDSSWMTKEWRVWNGNFYEVCSAGERHFIKVVNGEVIVIDKEEIKFD